jgi:hypothetical protein
VECIEGLGGKDRRKESLGNLAIDGRIKLKWIIEK